MPSLWMALLGLLAAVAFADDEPGVTTWPADPPKRDSLQLQLTNSSGLPNPQIWNVIPMIDNEGLNQSDTINQTVHINGIMIAADVTNYMKLTKPNIVAYISCDHPKGDSFITANQMLNTLILNSVKAIVLYSEAKNSCGVGNTDSLDYRNILTMSDSGDAQYVLAYLNATEKGRVDNVSISGNASAPDTPDDPTGLPGSRTNSAVAMSILYSITGLITLLFLIIIATGAVRAHRYPERYGPRGAIAGRPRQSRAKGLARAVLDTIPIVKFNNQQPTKPDPELELDTATMDGRDATTQRTVSNLTEDRHPEATPAVGNHNEHSAPAADSHQTTDESNEGGVNLGCSICTEDFKVGEDMRVLPCNHQFHPNCIDPWLVNVSGTCPLCRMDLRDGDVSSASHGNRTSRIFDVHGLRQASAEEQMAALRQMRRSEAEPAEPEAPEVDGEERGQRAHLTARLKEKFRIRTRARSPDVRGD
ncbi:E3 ubiquitin-protein ligase SDIR1 [Cladobotryum mycophilum]|uniref:RING-type E3 ubiquitin transferase n=1 Tax=Cladobotryum mycophilum TaxID=491253 RepID=A0ABR0SYQ8_9HYPO